MSRFFKPYEGKRPYVFISYSHRDSDAVLDIITELNDRTLRLWYDEGIPAGSDWPKNIEQHMSGCSAVLFFLSKTALASPNCFSEIKTAVETGKPVLTVPLEETAPNEEWSALLERADRFPAPCGDAAVESIRSWRVLRRSFYRKWNDGFDREWIGLAASLLLFAAVAAALAALVQGKFDPYLYPAVTPPVTAVYETAEVQEETSVSIPKPTIDPEVFPVSFPDTQQERAIRGVLGKKEGDVLRPELAEVTELCFCGNQVLRSMDGVEITSDGKLTLNGAEVLSGKVSDLSVIGSCVYLERLALVGQPLKDLSPLNGLVLLKELDLSGNSISDISALTDLPGLTVLHIEHTDIHDLTTLRSLPSLRTVTVSAGMLPLTWPEDRPFKVILVP